MSTILKFEPRPRAATQRDADRDAAVDTAQGEVVIFPGVRVERHGFKLSDRLPEPDPDRPGDRRRRRAGGK